MARSKKDRRTANTTPDFSLLGAMFNIPTRRDIERAAERRAAQTHHVRAQCRGEDDDDDDDDTSSSSASSSSEEDEAGAGEVRSKSAESSQQQQQQQQRSRSSSRRRGRSRTVKPRGQQTNDRHRQQQQQQQQQQGAEPSRQKSKSGEKQQQQQQQQQQRRQDSATQGPKQTLTKSLSSTSAVRPTPPGAPSLPPSASYPSFAPSQGFIRPQGIQPGGHPFAAPLPYYQAHPFALASCPPVVPPPVLQPSAAPMQPATTVLSPPPCAPQQPAGLVAQQIQRIQAEIDHKAALLSLNPGNQTLRNDLHALQTRLNLTLNAILDAKSPTPAAQTSPKPPTPADRATSTRDASDLNQESNIEPPRRGVSPGPAVRHHLCSGCGGVRSAKFHDKHPVIAGEKPVLNYCKSCQSTTGPESELLERYHFCFRCGIVRSKEFQRKHRKAAVLPNYCGKCTSEIQSIVGIAEASVVNFNSEPSSSETEEQGTSSSLVVEVTPEKECSSAQPHVPSSLNPSRLAVPKDQEASSAGMPPARHGDNANPPNAPQPRCAPGPEHRSPERPYFPHRSSGSAQRRAQRSSLRSSVVDSSEPDAQQKDDDASTQAYRAPYVEEDRSPTAHLKTDSPRHAPKSIFAPQQPAAFEQGRPSGPGEEQHFEESSGFVTEESSSDSTAAPEHNPSDSAEDAEPPRRSTQGGAFEDTARFWRGAFARRASPVEEQKPPSSSSPSSSSSSTGSSDPPPPPPPPHAVPRTTSSPEASGFTGFPNTHEHFSHPHGGSPDDDPPLRTSRGAFGSSAFRNSFFDPRSPYEYSASSSASPSPTGHQSSSWGGGPSSPFGMSSFAGFDSRFDPDFSAPPEDADLPHGEHGEHGTAAGSGSGYHNPYYIPRKRPSFGFFADLKGGAFGRRSRRVRGEDGAWSYAWRKPTPDWIPEPIIEEPASPPASPRQRAMLLEFGNDSAGTVSPVPPLSDASSDSSDADALSISDLDGDHHCDHSDEDDGGHEARFYED